MLYAHPPIVPSPPTPAIPKVFVHAVLDLKYPQHIQRALENTFSPPKVVPADHDPAAQVHAPPHPVTDATVGPLRMSGLLAVHPPHEPFDPQGPQPDSP